MLVFDDKNHYKRVRSYRDNPTKIEYTHEEVLEVLSLVKHKKWPNGIMSDDQCVLWEVIHRELDIPIPW